MLLCPLNFLEYGDIIGFESNDKFEHGKIVSIGKAPLSGYHKYEYYITIENQDGEHVTNVSLSQRQKFLLIKMIDDKNPARTRNNKENWNSIGIGEI